MIRAFNLNDTVYFTCDNLLLQLDMGMLCQNYTSLVFQKSGIYSSILIGCGCVRNEARTPRSEPQRTKKLGSGPNRFTREALAGTGQREDQAAEPCWLPWRITEDSELQEIYS